MKKNGKPDRVAFITNGPIAIDSSDGFPQDLLQTYPGGLQQVCEPPYFKQILLKHGYQLDELPLSAIIGITQIIRYAKTHEIRDQLSEKEKAFGIYNDGRWAYQFANPEPLIQPVPCKGQLGLWNVPRDLMEQIRLENPQITTQIPFTLPI